jgi:phosphoadenosine phosphosulfate reductase
MAAQADAFDLDAANRELEHGTPEQILAWTWKEFRPKVILTCSFQHDGVVLAHMLREIAPEVPVVFINTGFHFPETLAYRDQIVRRFGLTLVELQPIMPRTEFAERHGLDLYARNPDLCCHINKVEPLKRYLPGVRAWINGRRRDQASTRQAIRIVEAYPDGLCKINPIASWTSRETFYYMERHGIPTHPLFDQAIPASAARRARGPSFWARRSAPAAGRGRRRRSAACTPSSTRSSSLLLLLLLLALRHHLGVQLQQRLAEGLDDPSVHEVHGALPHRARERPVSRPDEHADLRPEGLGERARIGGRQQRIVLARHDEGRHPDRGGEPHAAPDDLAHEGGVVRPEAAQNARPERLGEITAQQHHTPPRRGRHGPAAQQRHEARRRVDQRPARAAPGGERREQHDRRRATACRRCEGRDAPGVVPDEHGRRVEPRRVGGDRRAPHLEATREPAEIEEVRRPAAMPEEAREPAPGPGPRPQPRDEDDARGVARALRVHDLGGQHRSPTRKRPFGAAEGPFSGPVTGPVLA